MNMELSNHSQLEQEIPENTFDEKLDVTNPTSLENTTEYNPDKRLDSVTMIDGIPIEDHYNPDKRLSENLGSESVTGEIANQLSDSTKEALLKSGLSPKLLENCTIKDDVVHLKTNNQYLENKRHPVTDVPFVKKIIILDDIKLEVVVPKFDTLFIVQLPPEKYQSSDNVQVKTCNEQLKNQLESDPDMKNKFTEREQKQIMEGYTPSNYTWHHNEERGKMELVRTDEHAATHHTGGRSIWGGGEEAR